MIQKKPSATTPDVTPTINSSIQSLQGGGQPLSKSERNFFEPRFGADFSDVRLHTDGHAASTAQSISARAFTHGNNVVFGAEYSTGSVEGKRLLAHELTHVVQQDKNTSLIQRKCAPADLTEKMTGCIQPVVVAKDDGKSKTISPSMGKVESIWEKCCTDFTIKSTQVVNKTDYQILDESKTNTPTVEQKALFAAAGASTCVQVFVPKTFQQEGKTSKDISGGGATYGRGTANPKVVVVEGTKPSVVAHEVGHATGYAGHNAVDNGTVMEPSGKYNEAVSSKVSKNVCTKARTGAVLTKTAKKDCCFKEK
ncbi:MAG: DUF4157 domain-containing protein [Alcanivoracaceae bacterium]|nr:DUF4157 domain-containing protein [Alcanivoracaceae bacterium]